MKQRLLTAGLLCLIILVVFLTKIVIEANFIFDILIAMIAVLAGMEMSTVLKNGNRSNHLFLIFIAPILFFGALILTTKLKLSIVIAVAILVACVLVIGLASFIISLLGKNATDKEMRDSKIYTTNTKFAFNKAMNTMFASIYPALLIGILFIFNHIAEFSYAVDLKTTQTGLLSITLLAIAFLLPCISDTFAYLTGKAFGGKKLAPSISENKTVAGAIGSIVWTTLLMTVLFIAFDNINSFSTLFAELNLSWWAFAILGFVGSIVCQAGDLSESVLKRKANMKDSSDILPGHGGVLDRVDGMTVTNLLVLIFVIIALL